MQSVNHLVIKIVEDLNWGCTYAVRLLPDGNLFFKPPILTALTFQPFDLEIPTISLWKDLDPVVDIVSAKETAA